MRNYASGFRLTDRLERYRSRTRQPGLQIDLPAAHTTVSVMRGAASHSVHRFLISAPDFLSIHPGASSARHYRSKVLSNCEDNIITSNTCHCEAKKQVS